MTGETGLRSLFVGFVDSFAIVLYLLIGVLFTSLLSAVPITIVLSVHFFLRLLLPSDEQVNIPAFRRWQAKDRVLIPSLASQQPVQSVARSVFTKYALLNTRAKLGHSFLRE